MAKQEKFNYTGKVVLTDHKAVCEHCLGEFHAGTSTEAQGALDVHQKSCLPLPCHQYHMPSVLVAARYLLRRIIRIEKALLNLVENRRSNPERREIESQTTRVFPE